MNEEELIEKIISLNDDIQKLIEYNDKLKFVRISVVYSAGITNIVAKTLRVLIVYLGEQTDSYLLGYLLRNITKLVNDAGFKTIDEAYYIKNINEKIEVEFVMAYVTNV